ncbi:thermonuclease family protein [Paenibacillus sp. Marseille-Q4541]|uniref:thermonuclease family protein n=1 Tax=Paenibacillus sp. Marseille-Q4541 TaxID=2831522 RepID=UPI001BA6ADE0|nr:thermonuclease family protein [Paenibacillus sp. Marseille-Q4541]
MSLLRRWVIPLVLCVTVFIAGCGEIQLPDSNTDTTTNTSNTDHEYPRIPVTLDRAVDGDTLKVMYEGKSESLRLLLVDTPETSHPKLGVQPLGKEAKEYTKQLLEQAKQIELEFDIGPNRDKYSRLLAYVYVDGVMLQESLLKKGYARVAYIYPPNVRYVDTFEAIQNKSKQQALGIWEFENYVQKDGFHPSEFEKKSSTTSAGTSGGKDSNSSNQNSTNGNSSTSGTGSSHGTSGSSTPPNNTCTIKGNINSKGEKIYHTTASRNYKSTNPETWFCTEEEAVAAGYRAPKN